MTAQPRTARPAVALAVVLLSMLVAPLDSAVNAAFPAITAAFGLEVAAIQWIVIAYMLAFSSLIVVSGRLADLFGYRRVFRAGLAFTALAFLGCGLAPAYGWLLTARVFQGVGIALTLGAGPALALSVYPESERTRVLAQYSAAFALGLALGPAVGGILVEHFGWRAVFLARAPLAFVALVLLRYVPAAAVKSGRVFDVAGAVLLATWTGALLLALALPGRLSLALGLVAVGSFAAFVVRESRAAEPTIRLSLFRDAAFSIPNLASVAVHFAGFTIFLLGPYFFVRVAGLSAQAGGMLLALGPAGAVLGSVLSGRLVMAFRARRVALAGMLLDFAGVAIAATWDAQTSVLLIAASLAMQGFGIGLFQVAYTDIVIATLPIEDRGVASSLANLTRTLGVVGSATAMSALFAYAERDALGAGQDANVAFLSGFDFAFTSAAAGLGVFLLLSLIRPRVWTRR